MNWIIPFVSAALVGTFLLTIVYWYIYSQYRDRFIGIWAVGWSIYTLRFVFELLLQFRPDWVVLLAGHQLFALFSGLLLLWGTYFFLGKPAPRWIFFLGFIAAIWIITGITAGFSWIVLNLPTFLFFGMTNIWTGAVLLKSREIEGMGKHLTGWAFIVWGIHKANYPFLRPVTWFAPWGFFFAALLEFVVASGTLLVYFQKMRKDLSVSEERFRLMAENARDFIFLYRMLPERGFEYVSPSAEVLTGYKPEEYYADCDIFQKVIHPQFHKMLSIKALEKKCLDKPCTAKWLRKEGKEIWVEQRVAFSYDEEGKVKRIEGIVRDVTERKRVEDKLQRYHFLSEHARDIIIFFDENGRIIEANGAALSVYDYSYEELLTMTVADLRIEHDRYSLTDQLKRAQEEALLYETIHRRKDGSTFPVEVSLQATVFDEGRILFAIVRDITERKSAEDRINYLAYHDSLTDLPNRILFYDRLNTALGAAKRHNRMLAVMFLDLDRFKFVNDIMGHAMGDKLLREVACHLKSQVRANDTVARIGGDEFTILLPEVNREKDVAKVARKIIQSFKKPWVISGCEFQITTSIGIVLFPNDGIDAESLTKNADTAMYRAKEMGDNYQFYTPHMNFRDIARIELESQLRQAVEQEELDIYYQPQVDVRTGKVIGMEALLRWNHPERGLVLPFEFIGVLEETGLITEVGCWVLRKACQQNKDWQKAGFLPLRIAVNISAHQFRQKDFVQKVAQVLKETQMAPDLLELEITESTAMQDVDFTIATLKKLRDMGVGIAIDDFGTGYSSLGYLRRFPITTLKVDQLFVRDVLSDVDDAAIVATIIVLAHNLRLKVIIEGIEDKQQLAFFKQQECYEMQGYLFSEPKSAEEISKNFDLTWTCNLY